MSRSYKQRPYDKWGKGSEKSDKRIANQKLRAAFRQALHRDPECTVPPLMKEVYGIYNCYTDGRKRWFGHMKHPRWDDFWQCWNKCDSAFYEKLMRK